MFFDDDLPPLEVPETELTEREENRIAAILLTGDRTTVADRFSEYAICKAEEIAAYKYKLKTEQYSEEQRGDIVDRLHAAQKDLQMAKEAVAKTEGHEMRLLEMWQKLDGDTQNPSAPPGN